MSKLEGAPAVGVYMKEPMVKNKICLLDADYLKYVVTYRIFKESEGKSYFAPLEKHLQKAIDDVLELIGDPIIFCFSGPSNKTFRYGIGFTKEYKGNRKGKIDPYHYDRKYEDMAAIIHYCAEKYVTLLFEDLEADDVVSALQAEDTYIMSKDKDLLQIPGWHFDGASDLIYISNEQAMLTLARQLITGDGTDNIPGIPGVGDRSAAYDEVATLPSSAMMKFVMLQYQKKFGLWHGTELFCEQYMLIKTRQGRGTFFREKYKMMYDVINGVRRYQQQKQNL